MDRVYCEVCDCLVEITGVGEMICGHTDYEYEQFEQEEDVEIKPLDFSDERAR